MRPPKTLLAALAAGTLLVGGGTAIAATGDSGSSTPRSGTQQQAPRGQAAPRDGRSGDPCPKGTAPRRSSGSSGSSSDGAAYSGATT
ncbi:hypothetical protein [Conexibacter woesei]|uniref:Uncharacterized protein n=1 Tax=Conexibacter woesei (strain DSM 14684 / CCUG 47730 / CIP 108061 / JCM 11494 / NBRC 100937 / ID131577) TaxID=469383 RepID=D3EZJ4_CONWI|nr:hypothetical protein [Conexibacter woesei]ADB53832.1 conserved hypothetical protein [Conexibacter woesei DSM 14684]